MDASIMDITPSHLEYAEDNLLGKKRIPKSISIVVSVYNEEDILPLFFNELEKNVKSLQINYEVIFINDGSTDGSAKIINSLCENNQNISCIHFSRNYGHEAAMTAGIDHSTGDVVLCMDSDMQNPPEMIGSMLKKYKEGCDIVLMNRIQNKGVGLYKRISSRLFYWMINRLSPVSFHPNASDFFLISRRVAEILKNEFRERIRFLRGFIQLIGFKQGMIDYTAPARVMGKSKYSLLRLMVFSLSTLASFSNIPLNIGVILGCIFSFIGLGIGLFSSIMKFSGYVIPGYTTIVVALSFFFAVHFIVIGIIGQYIGFLFIENKNRPIYIIDYTLKINKSSLNGQGDK